MLFRRDAACRVSARTTSSLTGNQQTGQVLSLQLARQGLPRRRHWQQERLLRNDDPSEHVRDDAWGNSARERDEEPEDAHERNVKLKIVSQPGTNARDLSVGAGAHQFLRHGRNAHDVSAVGAKAAILSNGLAASVAVHGCVSLFLGYDDCRGNVPSVVGRWSIVVGHWLQPSCGSV